MAKLSLTDLTSLANETSVVNAINANNALIEAALEKTLSRDGTSPNTMTAGLDMNSYPVYNATGIISANTLESFREGVGEGSVEADTEAFQLALAEGGNIFILPENTYYLGEGGVATQRINLQGGYMSKLVLDSDFSTSEDVITLQPAYGAEYVGWRISGLDIQPEEDGVARHAIAIDHTVHEYTSNALLLIEQVAVGAALSLTTYRSVSGYGIHYTPHPTNADGLYCSTFRNNHLVGGIYMTSAGDSLNFENNWIKGENRGMHIEFIAGAANGRFVGNNITAQGGAIYIKRGLQTRISDSQIELLAPWTGSSDRGMIVLEDSLSSTIDNNNIHASLLSSDHADCLILQGTTAKTILRNNNRMVTTSPYNHITSTSSQVPALIADYPKYLERPTSTAVTSPTTSFTAGTVEGLWSSAVTLINSWVASSLSGVLYEGLFYKVMPDGQVRLRGNISGGTNVDNVSVAVLPVIARPAKIQRFSIRVYNGTDYVSAQAAISTDGSITFPDALVATTVVSFDNSSYDKTA